MFTHNNAASRIFRTWTDFSRPVDRRTYITHGFALAAVKYVGDALLVYAASGMLWTPDRYVLGLPAFWRSLHFAPERLQLAPERWLPLALVIWMLPFVALGVTLSARRALDANRSPWLSVVFFIPFFNYLLMAILAFAPSEVPAPADATVVRRMPPSDMATAVMAGAAGVAMAVGATLIVGAALAFMPSYGGWLFLLMPFLSGTFTAFIYNRKREAELSHTLLLVLATVFTGGVSMLILPIEGVFCLLMGSPLIVALALVGAVVGRGVAREHRRPSPGAAFMLLALPLSAAVEPATGHVLHEVQSSVVINASPDVVWPHVIAFPEIPDPDDWLFRAGIAYPIRARIEGSGVGAVRYCVFSTGPFVEPITRWEPGRRLSFDVAESPATMRELSPYEDLSPAHVHGYLRAKRGEFRFVDLGDGRTRLEGSTWYELEMTPEVYWQIFTDALIHRIHTRVLEHIRREVEGSEDRSQGTGDRR